MNQTELGEKLLHASDKLNRRRRKRIPLSEIADSLPIEGLAVPASKPGKGTLQTGTKLERQ